MIEGSPAPVGPGAARPPLHEAEHESEAAWAKAAAAVLRKSGRLAADEPASAAWERLARTTVEGVIIPPLGTAERSSDLPTAAALAADPGQAPYLRGSKATGGWDVRAHVADPDPARAHAAVMSALGGGVTSLWLEVGPGGTAPSDIPAIFRGVVLDAIPVVFDGGAERSHADDADDGVLAAARALARSAHDDGQRLNPDGSLGADPIGHVAARTFSSGGASASAPSSASALSAATPSSAAGPGAPTGPELTRSALEASVRASTAAAAELGIGAIVVDGTVAHQAGAGDAGEIAYSLACGAQYLRALTASGLPVDEACRLLSFRYAVTDDQFVSIAKLRAARLVWQRVAELSGASPAVRSQRQHAVTSRAMATKYDPWMNLLRGTIGAFAAAVGGAEAITVTPFDSALGIPDDFGQRMARNVSALLAGESHIDATADPASGAYAVESLTGDLARAAWARFREIESAGGILAALADGRLASRIAATRGERNRRIATRRQPITGVSEFPRADEDAASLPPRVPAAGPPTTRWAAPFEAMRDHPTASPVLLLRLGSRATASTRLGFARNLLAAGGIGVHEADAEADIADALAEYPSAAVVFAGSDAAYANDLTAAAHQARSHGACAIFVAGRTDAVRDAVSQGLVDGAVATGDDVVQFLSTVRGAGEVRP